MWNNKFEFKIEYSKMFENALTNKQTDSLLIPTFSIAKSLSAHEPIDYFDHIKLKFRVCPQLQIYQKIGISSIYSEN